MAAGFPPPVTEIVPPHQDLCISPWLNGALRLISLVMVDDFLISTTHPVTFSLILLDKGASVPYVLPALG